MLPKDVKFKSSYLQTISQISYQGLINEHMGVVKHRQVIDNTGDTIHILNLTQPK